MVVNLGSSSAQDHPKEIRQSPEKVKKELIHKISIYRIEWEIILNIGELHTC